MAWLTSGRCAIVLGAATVFLTAACGPVSDGTHALSGSPATEPAGLRLVHSPNRIAKDETLAKGQCHAVNGDLEETARPDPGCTPGAIDPAVTQANIGSTICQPGYTSLVRPPLSLSSPVKGVMLSAYGLSGPFSDYELDHLVPLELGGANSVSNLWPEIGHSPNPKDSVENKLHADVCAGRVPLARAQQEIAQDWTGVR